VSNTSAVGEIIDVGSIAAGFEDDTRNEVTALQRGGPDCELPTLAIASDQRIDIDTISPDPSERYVQGLCSAAERAGVAYRIRSGLGLISLHEALDEYNLDSSVHGSLVTLPLAIEDTDRRQAVTANLLSGITPSKDVDGLNPGSGVIPATVEAAYHVASAVVPDLAERSILVRGGNGHIGGTLVRMLKEKNYTVNAFDRGTPNEAQTDMLSNSDVIFSATGAAHSLAPEHFGDVADSAPKTLINIGRGMAANGKLAGDFATALKPWALERGWSISGDAKGVGRLATLIVVRRTVTAARRLQDRD
jgi:5,10-methylene-tetrahydrofolate dehydrogenase/methenyl tetrahydrofolate cyclohydrolase